MTEKTPTNPANLSGCCGGVRFTDNIWLCSNGPSLLYGTVERCSKCLKPSGALKVLTNAPGVSAEAVMAKLKTSRGSKVDLNEVQVEDFQRMAAGEQ